MFNLAMHSDPLGAIASTLISAALGQDAQGEQNQSPRQRIKIEVMQKIIECEKVSREEAEPSIFGMYLHFFWSIFVLMESALYLALYIMLAAVVGIGNYVLLFLSCGKGCTKQRKGDKDNTWDLYTFYGKRVAVYFMFLSGMIMNLLRPWNPPMLLYRSGSPLIGPDGSWQRSPRDIAGKDCTCCCFVCCDCEQFVDRCCESTCGCNDQVNDGSEKEFFGTGLPMWATLRMHLLTVGGIPCMAMCGSSITHDCMPQCCKFSDDIEAIRERVLAERQEETRAFYNKEYGNNVNCFEDLLSFRGVQDSHINHTGDSRPSYAAPSAPMNRQNGQNYASHQPTVVRGVPVSSSGVQITEAVPLNSTGKY